jgi:hypothetical protein
MTLKALPDRDALEADFFRVRLLGNGTIAADTGN